MTSRPALDATEHLLRELVPQVLGAVTRRLHELVAAEGAVRTHCLRLRLQKRACRDENVVLMWSFS